MMMMMRMSAKNLHCENNIVETVFFKNVYEITFGIKSKFATLVEGDLKALFSIATTLMCRGGRSSIP